MTLHPDAQDVLALAHQYCDGINRRDFPSLASVFAEDARWMVPGLGLDIRGRSQIRAFIEDGFRTIEFLVHLIGSQHVVGCDGELAHSYTTFQAFLRHTDGTGFQYVILYDDMARRDGSGWEFTSRSAHFLLRNPTPPGGVTAPLPPMATFD
jgi:ketosteroid isomerase-like protein